jgi:hypothetical protein
VKRLEQIEPNLVLAIARSAARGNWKSAAWLLERRWPERWGRPTERRERWPARVQDEFAEVDAIAERRRWRGRSDHLEA